MFKQAYPEAVRDWCKLAAADWFTLPPSERTKERLLEMVGAATGPAPTKPSHEQQGTGHDSGAAGHEQQGRQSKPARCGSYPFRYIAEDFGLPYDVVLNYADVVLNRMQPSHWALTAFDYVERRLHSYDHDRLYAAIRLQLQGIGALP